MSEKVVHVALAILYREGQFLLQLRDNIPGIVYPGYWGLFGGHLEPGETPEMTLKRELQEEIGYLPPQVWEFGSYQTPEVVRHVFHAPLTVGLDELVLNEGWDMGLWTPEDIRRGDRYSEKADEVRPLGGPHQQIFLQFIERGLLKS
ncbi:NUDIX hydrolase [Phormidium sp. CCY1219]|uniref:NUDIX hydrolase n=1 Tax=Phormidium sp. CCY1219 TaxID=2886104 RepID=UPI002D1F68C7|nr:NUDIX hydrolase [Phormidium sp. CCY1219]MEB3830411.1 NUDIX hydrolase [Phormidium sp. CCY1219]